MSDRRRRLLDAAITVLGTRGLRQLTHRAVDAEACLPEGSTSNAFRTREALIGGVLDRLVEVETGGWERLAGAAAVGPAHPAPGRAEADGFAALIAAMVRELAGPGRRVTLARHAVFHEAAFHPELQRRIAANRARLARWGVPWFARIGSPDPRADHLAMLALIDGLLATQLASPEPDFDPEPAIRLVLRGMLAPDRAPSRD